MKLSDREAKFCAEYMKDRKAGPAAARAGYGQKSAYTTGPRLLRKPQVRARVDEMIGKIEEKAIVTQSEVLAGVKRIAVYCETIKNGRMNDPHAGNRSYELLGKHLKMFTDKVEVTPSAEFAEMLRKANERASKADE